MQIPYTRLCQHVPIDVVYTWVNGSDPWFQVSPFVHFPLALGSGEVQELFLVYVPLALILNR